MTKTQAGFALVFLVCIVGLIGYSLFLPTPEPEAPTRWEYRIENPSDISFTLEMNQLGEQRWELVFARRARDSSTEEYHYEMIFKRPTSD